MFKAFGLDRSSVAPSFTGEDLAQSSSADAEGEAKNEEDELAGAGEGRGFGSGHGRLSGSHREKKSKGDAPADDLDSVLENAPRSGADSPGFAGPAPAATRPQSVPAEPQAEFEKAFPTTPSPPPPPPRPAQIAGGTGAAAKPTGDLANPWENSRRPQRVVPMKRVFDRNGGFEAVNTLARQNAGKLVVAESTLASTPDSRDKTVELYALYATSGRLGEAQELTARWSGRDALDPDALTARADLAARQGDRDRAVRILGGLTDVRPTDRATQVRLAELQEAAGNQALACEHRIALANIAMSEAKLVSEAVRCSRAQGMNELATLLRADTTEKVRDAVDRLLAAAPTSVPVQLRGDVQITAQWTGGEDLDIALIDAQGKRISWLGSPTKAAGVTVRDATSPRAETLAVSNLPAGSYVIEITRASGERAGSFAQGDVTIRVVNDTRKIPFTLSGPRAEIGTARVFFTSRLVPVNFGW